MKSLVCSFDRGFSLSRQNALFPGLLSGDETGFR